jgi:hypothetical protein
MTLRSIGTLIAIILVVNSFYRPPLGSYHFQQHGNHTVDN